MRESALPTSTSVEAMNQVCAVAAAMRASNEAREAGRSCSEIEAALSLRLVAEDSSDGE